MKIDSAKIEALRELLAAPRRKIVLVAHTNPDGDAIGASTAWRDVLAAMGHEVTMIVPNKYPYFLDWMPDIREVVIFRFAPERALEAIRGADIVFCLDFNSLSRLEALSDALAENTAARRVLIDHHLSPDGGFDLQFSYPQSSSTCFLLYCIIEQLCGTEVITRKMAEALYVGMMTDTGNFSFSFLTPALYRALAVLVEKGIDVAGIHNSVYNGYTEDRARLFGYAIHRKMNIIQEGTAAYMSLTEAEMRRYRFQQGDSEGFVNYPLTIKRCGRQPLCPQIFRRRRTQECRRGQILCLDGRDDRSLYPFGRGVRLRGRPRYPPPSVVRCGIGFRGESASEPKNLKPL